MIKCKICGKELKNLGPHLKTHNISPKNYYDKFLRVEGEGKCKLCGKETKFIDTTNGYRCFCKPCSFKYMVQKAAEVRLAETLEEREKWISKRKQTNIERYGVTDINKSSEFISKREEDNLKKHGVIWPSMLADVKEKISNTVSSKGCQEQTKQTKFEKYGDENYNNREKNKETCLEKYGYSNFAKTLQFREHMQQLWENEEFYKNRLTRYWYNNEVFDSSYELCFYKYHFDKNHNIKRNNQGFMYVFNGVKHECFPDFIVDNQYIEIKGAHFFENDKMINPFDRKLDGLYEAKHQCMINNNVKIITDCKEYLDYVNMLQKDFIEKCSLKRVLNLDNLQWEKLTTGSQRVVNIVKKANAKEFYKREIEFWKKNIIEHKILYENRLRYINKQPNELSDLEILRGLSISGKIRAYSTFNNTGMKEFIEKYNITSIFDPCAGWGERLVTCAALYINYLGIDINPKVIEGHQRIIEHYNLTNQKTICGDSSKYINNENFDATFTCPPYWNEEIYTEQGAENLSYEDFISWWKQIVEKSNTEIFAYQINCKYKEDMNKVLLDLGYSFIEEIELPSKSSHFTRGKNGINKKREYESIQVFKK